MNRIQLLSLLFLAIAQLLLASAFIVHLTGGCS